MPKRKTDTELLDWIEKTGALVVSFKAIELSQVVFENNKGDQEKAHGKTLRSAITKAMRAKYG